MEQNRDRTGRYLIHILVHVLKNQKPEEKPEGVTFESLFRIAKFHSVAAMACYGVERLDVKPDEKLYKEWKKYRDLNMAKSFVQLSERDRILEKLVEKGIAVLPLKGCLLKEMYPQRDYREMADLDILVDASKAEEARTEMERLGYQTVQFAAGNHDNYKKPPYMGVELHRDMISKRYETHTYYKDVWTKAIADEEREGIYHFSWDDYYIFMIAHSAKHYFSSGSGIRTFMDIYVFLQKYGRQLHPEYLKQELEKMNLWQFKQDAEELAGVWFEEKEAVARMREMECYVMTSGVYGTTEKKVENDIRVIESKVPSFYLSRIIYCFQRCFLNYKDMCSLYPFLKKIPLLLPIFWVHRLVFSVFAKRERIAGELRGMKRKAKRAVGK